MSIYLADYKCYNDKCKTIREYVLNNFKDKLAKNAKNAKFIICIGGDGTLIKTVHDYKKYNLPILGINAGTVGFMLNSSNYEEIDKIFKDDFEPHYIPVDLIKVVVNDEEYFAFNEVAIGGDMMSWINFNIGSSYELNGEVTGGGIIISSAQGSTGINKNNGGPILPLESNLWSVTGDKTTRKIQHVITPHEIKIHATSRGKISLWCDGHEKLSENNTMTVKVMESFQKIQLGFTYPERFMIKRRDSRL